MKRAIEKQLLYWKKAPSRKPLLIKGVRQVGKTFSITEFGRQSFANLHHLNFEKNSQLASIFAKDFSPQRIINELSFALQSNIDVINDLVFFDEIQACPRALTSLKYFCEDMPKLALCAAGSLLGVHLNSEPFPVGKVDMLNMFPLSFEEFLAALQELRSLELLQAMSINSDLSDQAHEYLWGLLKLYFVVGGMPEAVALLVKNKENLFEALQKVRKKQEELISGYNADMAKHAGKANALHLDRIWKEVPAQLARSQNAGASKFKFKGVVPGMNRYSKLADAFAWLENAGLITKVSIINSAQLPFNAYSKDNSFKLFTTDVGILGALSGLSPKTILDYDYGTYKGYFAENFVAQELLYSGSKTLFSWCESRSEIEFLEEIAGNVIPIEVKSGWITRAQSLKIFSGKYRPNCGVILSAQKPYFDNKTNVYRCPLYLAGRVVAIIQQYLGAR